MMKAGEGEVDRVINTKAAVSSRKMDTDAKINYAKYMHTKYGPSTSLFGQHFRHPSYFGWSSGIWVGYGLMRKFTGRGRRVVEAN